MILLKHEQICSACFILRKIWRWWGEAANGEEAIAKVAELLPDIVLMDVNMPVMDGITATEIISRTYPNVAVVIISIQGEQEYLKKAMVAGGRGIIWLNR